ncbi:MAG TPA: hypothetical protein VNH11_24170 [Pirellulales bacterium]|nr:hypothetical protein [Pirellulales bacterium]
MKTVNLNQTNLEACIEEAQRGSLLILRNGAPAAVLLGVEGMDQEQVELGLSDRFWKLIAERRQERTLSRAQLEEKMSGQS